MKLFNKNYRELLQDRTLRNPNEQSFANIESTSGRNNTPNLITEGMMLSPAIASAGLTATDLLGITNKYKGTLGKDIDALQQDVTPVTIGDKIGYNPVDTNYLVNLQSAQNASTRRALQNMSGGNRANAQANLLAADRNMLRAVGDLGLQSKLQNIEQRHKVADFNRGTNMANMEAINQAKFENRRAKQELGLRSAMAREDERNRLSKNRASNLQALIDSVGEYGLQRARRADIASSSQHGYVPLIGGGIGFNPDNKRIIVNNENKPI